MRRIVIRNTLNSPVYVRPHLRGGWKAADYVIGFAEFALGVNDLKGALMVAGLSDLPEVISSFEDAHDVFGGLRQIDEGAVNVKILRNIGDDVGELKDKISHVVGHFKKMAFPITPGESRNVFDRGVIDEITTPDGIASLLGAKTIALAIITEDETRHVDFISSDTAEWAVTPTGVVNQSHHQQVHHWNRVPLGHHKS